MPIAQIRTARSRRNAANHEPQFPKRRPNATRSQDCAVVALHPPPLFAMIWAGCALASPRLW
eukprot:8163406-Alexandrium_andersonii.AAC.1